MTKNVLHLLSAVAKQKPLPAPDTFFYARRNSSVSAPANESTFIEMDNVIDDPDSLLSAGEFTVPSTMNGYWAQFNVGMYLNSSARAQAGLLRSEGGSFFTLASDYREGVTFNLTRTIKLKTGDRFRPYMFVVSVPRTVEVSIRTYFEAHIYRDI